MLMHDSQYKIVGKVPESCAAEQRNRSAFVGCCTSDYNGPIVEIDADRK